MHWFKSAHTVKYRLTFTSCVDLLGDTDLCMYSKTSLYFPVCRRTLFIIIAVVVVITLTVCCELFLEFTCNAPPLNQSLLYSAHSVLCECICEGSHFQWLVVPILRTTTDIWMPPAHVLARHAKSVLVTTNKSWSSCTCGRQKVITQPLDIFPWWQFPKIFSFSTLYVMKLFLICT